MEYSSREQLTEEACRIIAAAHRAVGQSSAGPLIDLLTTAQGYLQLFNEQPEKSSYETKLRQAIRKLDAALEESA